MRRHLLLIAGVAALVAWGVGEVEVYGQMGPKPPVPLWWAIAVPLPLLLLPLAPGAAGTGVVALVLLRGALDGRPAASVCESALLMIALFAAEGSGARRGAPWRGAALGALLLGGVTVLHLAGAGAFASWDRVKFVHTAALVLFGVGAGFALRDRRQEAEWMEAELDALHAVGEERIGSAVAVERRRMAAELEGTVARLLHGVRPLAARAAAAAEGPAIERDMREVQARTREAMTEMRRALHLLRGPVPDGEGVSLAAVAASARRHRRARVAGAVAPVALLSALMMIDAAWVPPRPFTFAYLGGEVVIDPPLLGAVSPYVTAVLAVLPLLARHRFPLAAALAVDAAVIGRMLLGDASLLTFTQYYVIGAAAFLCAAHARSWPARVAIAVAGAASSAWCLGAEGYPYEPFDYVFAVVFPLGAAACGGLVAGRVAGARRARHAQRELDAEHECAARERVMAERLQAARELHDVVGHAVTVIALQAAAGETLAHSDLDRARATALTVGRLAADAEADLIRLGAALGEDVGAEAPASLDELVRRARIDGLPVVLDLEADLRAVPPGVARTAFRVVQEALTNVRRHAGLAPTRVRVRDEGGVLVVDVRDDGGSAPLEADDGGRGLPGMRERVELYGGRLEAGPEAGGWRVRAELPLDESAVAAA
jgi:signal transduction histidine kinase